MKKLLILILLLMGVGNTAHSFDLTGLLGYWKLNENTGTTAANAVAGQPGFQSITNMAWVSGFQNYGLQTSASPSAYTTSNWTMPDNQKFTAGVWMKTDGTGGADCNWLSWGDVGSTSKQGFWLSATKYTGNVLRSQIVCNGNGNYWSAIVDDAGSAFSSNTWYHYTVSYDGSTKRLKMYWNGSLIYNQVQTGTAPTNIQTSATPLRLCNLVYNGSNFYAGSGWTIDQPYFFNRILTDAEVAAINTNNGIDLTVDGTGLVGFWKLNENTGTSSANNWSGGMGMQTMTNTAWVTGYEGSGIQTNASAYARSTGYITASDDTKITVNSWLKLGGSGGQGSSAVAWGDIGNTKSGLWVSSNWDSNNLFMNAYICGLDSGSVARVAQFTPISSVAAEAKTNWHMYTMTFDCATHLAKFYIDGALFSTQTDTLNIAHIGYPANSYIDFFRFKYSGTYYYGDASTTYDDIAILQRVLTDTEIGVLYTNNSISDPKVAPTTVPFAIPTIRFMEAF